jgi:hypothetical protein
VVPRLIHFRSCAPSTVPRRSTLRSSPALTPYAVPALLAAQVVMWSTVCVIRHFASAAAPRFLAQHLIGIVMAHLRTARQQLPTVLPFPTPTLITGLMEMRSGNYLIYELLKTIKQTKKQKNLQTYKIWVHTKIIFFIIINCHSTMRSLDLTAPHLISSK